MGLETKQWSLTAVEPLAHALTLRRIIKAVSRFIGFPNILIGLAVSARPFLFDTSVDQLAIIQPAEKLGYTSKDSADGAEHYSAPFS